MIIKKVGDLLSVTKGHLVHGCNAQGVMGNGIALQIKHKYPKCFDLYRKQFEQGTLELGYAIPCIINDDLVIWNAITQESFGTTKERFVSYDALEEAFDLIEYGVKLFPHIEPVINFPLIGAGLGNGKWPIIEAIIDNTITYEKVLWELE